MSSRPPQKFFKIDAGDLAQHPGVESISARHGQGGEQAGDAMIGDGQIIAAGLLSEGTGEPAPADAAGAGEQQVMAGAEPVVAGELEEQGAVEAAGGAVVDIFDAGGLAQLGGAGAAFELLLPAQVRLLLQEQGQPLGVIEAAALGLGGQLLEAAGHAVEAEGVQQIERGMTLVQKGRSGGGREGEGV